jgi:DNA-binding XRE family transcriptional regulator
MKVKSAKARVRSTDVVGSDFGDYVAEAEARLSPASRAVLDAFRDDFTLASQLIQMRKGQKLTQVELAERAGVDQSAISRIERGSVNASYASLQRIGRVFGARIAFIPSTEASKTQARAARA